MIGCVVQARMGSSRLPGKTLMKLTNELSTLDFVINQISSSSLIEKIIIATTDLEGDNIVENTEDLELIKKIISEINKRPILLNDILDLISTQSDLLKINQHISNNEGMQKSLNQDRDFKN